MTGQSYRLEEWPAGGLERVAACPLCGSNVRSILHAGLQDHAFKSAPGKWTLHQCGKCGCAYLDPRPDATTIGLAYERYYTHETGPAKTGFARLRRRVADAYLNHRYGMSFPDAFPGGHHVAKLLPRSRGYLDVSNARHLGTATGENTRLLDVGCGNGEFLQFAAQLGWAGEGIDNDASAVDVAQAAGCKVILGKLDELPFLKARYRHVTLSHVIEHVHDPIRLLRQCLDLLCPGGRLWLETPNLQSLGHDVFGSAWRGLEPPRHLILFDRRTLATALAGAGFSQVEFHEHPGVAMPMWEQSRGIARDSGSGIRGGVRKLLAAQPGAIVADYYSALRADRSEFLTCTALRPGGNVEAGA